jgi:hypothetical protein
LHLRPRIEPGDLDPDKERRPDIQLDLPDVTLLGDVTISHPDAKRWRHTAASRGVEPVGDSRQAEKDEAYTPMAAALGMQFSAIVLYTYGGFHHTALSFIRHLGRALDPATCLVSHTKWKKDLMEHIAVAVQRGNADIMIQHSVRLRGMAWPIRSTARSSRGRALRVRSGRGRSDRRGATVVGGAAGDRAAALAARLIPPISPRTPLFVPPGAVAPDLAVEVGGDADSDADTVVQSASHLDQMQVVTELEVLSPFCFVEPMPESPLGAAPAREADVVPTGADAACVDAALVVADGRELQDCPTVTAVQAIVNIVPTTTACVGLGVNELRVGMEAAADGSLQLDMSVIGDFKLAELHRAEPRAGSRSLATTTDVVSGSAAGCASDGGSSDGDAAMSDAVTVVFDCSNSVAVADDAIAANAVLDDVAVPRRRREEVADAVEELDDRVPPSRLAVTWSWLMEE